MGLVEPQSTKSLFMFKHKNFKHKNFKLVGLKHVHASQLYIEPKICPSVVTQALIPYVTSPDNQVEIANEKEPHANET